MLYSLHLLSKQFLVFNVFRYLTFRGGAALFTATLILFILGPKMITQLRRSQKNGQPIRNDGPKSHLTKKIGTPTMGGLIILFAVTLSTLLWISPTNPYPWIVIVVMLSYGVIGFYDDSLKVKQQSSRGLSKRFRLLCECAIGLGACVAIYALCPEPLKGKLAVPFFKQIMIDMNLFYILFGTFVIVSFANGVNFTDGLDGLAIMPVLIASAAISILAFLVGNSKTSAYLYLNYIPGVGELMILCCAVVGAGLGFLWFNAPPAQIYMGDTGSLALGGMLGTVAVILKQELVICVIGGVFVLEALSVVVQIISYKLTKKRVFRMAPIHHHFEQKGWEEPQIVIRFWIIAVLLALTGLTSLKIR